jgi:hypothetical protein
MMETLLATARDALAGAMIPDVELAITQLQTQSDLFCPVMIDVNNPISNEMFAGMCVITILQIRGRLKD